MLNILLQRPANDAVAHAAGVPRPPTVHIAGTTLQGRLDLDISTFTFSTLCWSLGEISIELVATERWVSAMEWIERDLLGQGTGHKIRYQGSELPPSAACVPGPADSRNEGFHIARTGRTSFAFAFHLPKDLPSSLPTAPMNGHGKTRTQAGITYVLVASVACRERPFNDDNARSTNGVEASSPIQVVVARRQIVVVSDQDVAAAPKEAVRRHASNNLTMNGLQARLQVISATGSDLERHQVFREMSQVFARVTFDSAIPRHKSPVNIKLTLLRRVRTTTSDAGRGEEILETLAEQAFDGATRE